MNNFENKIYIFDELPSTHKYLKEESNNYLSGSVIVANTQTNGIGTKGHTWHTGKGNIAMSIIYKPDCKIKNLDGLTIQIAEMIKEIILNMFEIELKIKAPNDLLLDNKKIAGILTESSTIGEKINYLIISIGMNLEEKNFPEELVNTATSLRIKLGDDINIDKIEIIKEIIKKLNCIVKKIENF